MAMTKPSPVDYFDLNRTNWDERADIHIYDEADWYGIEGFKQGGERRAPVDIEGMGDLTGKRVLHSQCHFGLDTLSAARFADSVVGLDFSEKAIDFARKLADETGLADKATFVCANVYDADKVLEPESFDMVYASWGVTGWLHDLEGWAQTLCSLLKPGGTFFYADAHPFAWCFDDDETSPENPVKLAHPYYIPEPIEEDFPLSYNESKTLIKQSKTIEFAHTIEDFMQAFIKQNMHLKAYQELEALPWKMFACMEQREGSRLFYLPEHVKRLPLGFAFTWEKPA